MRVLVTGASGFIGRNLVLRLQEKGHEAACFTRGDESSALPPMVADVDAIFHLAGENRPADQADFERVNFGLTKALAEAVVASGNSPLVVFASSTQAALENLYGRSKRGAEDVLEGLAKVTNCPVALYRLPGVFGKWGRPGYNSVVHTFCHNIARGIPVTVDDPVRSITLVHVDDVVTSFLSVLDGRPEGISRPEVSPQYEITLGALYDRIQAFARSRETLVTESVGSGLTRALYATYISYLPTEAFRYSVPTFSDARGTFVEMLKTNDAGQFSYFTAHPGVTRGGHYHHSKTEKFLVIRGEASFRFRNLLTDERLTISTSGSRPEIVETVPGWAHDITNTGKEELIVLLWANEVFDRENPDTIACGL